MSRELRSARQLVANTLQLLGYEPDWQDIFDTEEGELRGMIRRRIDESAGVVQLVGQCYGAEPPTIDEQFGRVSYTQYEALYAKQRGKKVWYLLLDPDFTADPHDAEPEERRALQVAYRERIRVGDQLYHPLGNSEELENKVLKLRDDLAALRRRGKQWAVGVIALLVLIAGLVGWVIKHEVKLGREQVAMNAKMDRLLAQGIAQYPSAEAKAREAQPGQKPKQIEERAYADLARNLGVDARTLREKLPAFAEQLKRSPDATTYERANAAFVAKDYAEAERLALNAAEEAQKADPSRIADALKALELAGWSAQNRIDYARALDHFHAAVALTNRQRDALEWARVQYEIAFVLYDQGHYSEAETIVRDIVSIREEVLGPEHPDTLASRNILANALTGEGKYAEAEAEHREVLKLREKVLGPEHPDTLGSRNNLANALDSEGKYAETESEYRAVLKLEEKVLGAEHPDTLTIRNNLANALRGEGKYAEAEAEHREVLKLREKVLGAEHPDTLGSRNNLAIALAGEGKYAEAESEYRAVVKLEEKVHGAEHPDTLRSRNNLANALYAQGKYAEAESENRALLKLAEKVLGPEHPDTLGSRNNLANALDSEGKYAEAEAEYRAVLKLREKVLGPEHPDTLRSRDQRAWILATCPEAKIRNGSEAMALATNLCE
ncbi:MAG TPA: tetratricopeptide repeat protein, partial [Candidatus Udaeobacter sp.]|nr:tetratricopeptide repeat protein [Candidatus Udaeobacter sp.]